MFIMRQVVLSAAFRVLPVRLSVCPYKLLSQKEREKNKIGVNVF